MSGSEQQKSFAVYLKLVCLSEPVHVCTLLPPASPA